MSKEQRTNYRLLFSLLFLLQIAIASVSLARYVAGGSPFSLGIAVFAGLASLYPLALAVRS